jgi:hypothetical protein
MLVKIGCVMQRTLWHFAAMMWIGLPLMTSDAYNIKHDEFVAGMLHFDSCIQMPGDGSTQA